MCQHGNYLCIAKTQNIFFYKFDVLQSCDLFSLWRIFAPDVRRYSTYSCGLVYPSVLNCLPPGRLLDKYPVLEILVPSLENSRETWETLWNLQPWDVWAAKRQVGRMFAHRTKLLDNSNSLRLSSGYPNSIGVLQSYFIWKGCTRYLHVMTKVPPLHCHFN